VYGYCCPICVPLSLTVYRLEAAKALAADVGIPTHLRELGVPKEALEGLATATMNVTRLLANNPKELTQDDVRGIWEKAW